MRRGTTRETHKCKRQKEGKGRQREKEPLEDELAKRLSSVRRISIFSPSLSSPLCSWTQSTLNQQANQNHKAKLLAPSPLPRLP